MALTEGRYAAEFILSEANGSRSRSTGTLDTGDLAAGTVVMFSGSKLVAYTGSSIEAAGILLYAADATNGDVTVPYIDCDAEVNGDLLTYTGTLLAATTSLALLGIKVR